MSAGGEDIVRLLTRALETDDPAGAERRAEAMVDYHRSEVLNEAADELEEDEHLLASEELRSMARGETP